MSSQQEEKTFREFNKESAKNYSATRLDYQPELFELMLSHHTATGGSLDTVVDVGCGPGNATRTLAARFRHAAGFDPSEGMIEAARGLGGTAGVAPDGQTDKEPIRYDVAPAEALPLPFHSVDLLTAAKAAHWFDMDRFWSEANRVLKPGGTVALWCAANPHIDASRTPNGAAIQAAITELEERELRPFYEPGNLLVREFYANLPLPWTVTPGQEAFEKDSFYKCVWDPTGAFTGEGREIVKRSPFVEGRSLSLDHLRKMWLGASPVVRWREANREKVDTEEDVVVRMQEVVKRLSKEAGVEEGKELLFGGTGGVLLMVKKK